MCKHYAPSALRRAPGHHPTFQHAPGQPQDFPDFAGLQLCGEVADEQPDGEYLDAWIGNQLRSYAVIFTLNELAAPLFMSLISLMPHHPELSCPTTNPAA